MSVVVNVVGQSAVSVSVAASTSVSVVASGGIGPAGFITVPGTSTQAFGTFQLQAGDGITVSTADGQFLISSYPSTTVSSLSPVQNVAGRTGSIVLQASDVTAGTFAIGRIPTIGYTALSGVPTTFAPASHTHDAAAISSGTLSIARVPTISYTALSNTPATFTPSAHTHTTTDVVAFTAAASAAAPVQSVQSRTGAVVLTRADLTAAAEVHSHSTADIVGLTAAFSQVGHTHDAAAVTSGTLDIARIPVIGYTAISGTPSSFAPGAHTHSTTDITGYQGLPAQAGSFGPLVTDGTSATFTSRYSIVSPVLVQGAGMTLTRDTSAGSITVAFAGGTSGLAVGSLAPLALGVAAAGTSGNASREDHVHRLPTVGDITAAAASHTHDAAAIASGTIDAARLPATVSAINALTGGITIAAGANVTVSTASSTITIAAGGGGGSGEDTVLRSFFLPPPPTSVTATAGNAQAVVSWTAPTVLAQTPITDYIVQFSSDSGSTWTTAAESITITTQPANQTAASGAATFSVTAAVSPSGTATYQWEKSDDGGTTFAAVAGATSATLSLTSLTNGSDNNDQYRVVVSAVGASPVTSSAATLTVEAAAGLVITTAGSGTGSWSGDGTLASKFVRTVVGNLSWTVDPVFTAATSGTVYVTIGSRSQGSDFDPDAYIRKNGVIVQTIGYYDNPQFSPVSVVSGDTIQLSSQSVNHSLNNVAVWLQ